MKRHLRRRPGDLGEMNVTERSGRIIRQAATSDTAEQCMNVFSTNKNTPAVKLAARSNFRPLAPVWGINTRQWSRLGLRSIFDDTIISYVLTLGSVSCGRVNESRRQNKASVVEIKFCCLV